ncbi:hypothetical protein ACN20G_33155 (plasmid) [Streptomyces sp. BI20]|uniref:hypothetical protein n=1 Tax=Streptomyces sp. BI20 TaxID=3403460 RepID=UPI003C75E01E
MTPPLAPTAPPVTPEALRALLDPDLHEETVGAALAADPDPEPSRAVAERRVLEALRYLWLVSAHPDRLAGLFLPVEQAVDEVWHHLILQTREYRDLCEQRLPGGFFVHHRGIAYTAYTDTAVRGGGPDRRRGAEEALRWIPPYVAAFGPFDEGALPHWTMVRFLHEELGLSLAEISALEPPPPTP